MALTPDDREDIRDLMAKYAFAIDFGDCEAYASTFTPTGTFWCDGWGEDSIVQGRHTGREALFNFCKLCFESYKGYLRHLSNGVQLMQGTGQRAEVRSYMMGVTVGTLPDAQILETGVYYDQVVKLDGRWLFEERHFIADPQFEHRGQSFDAAKFTQDMSGTRDL